MTDIRRRAALQTAARPRPRPHRDEHPQRPLGGQDIPVRRSLLGPRIRVGPSLAAGEASFLAEPNRTFRGRVDLANIELDYFKPITNRYNLWVDKGVLSTSAEVEYGQDVKTAVKSVAIEGIHVDYVHTARTAIAELDQREKVAAAAREVNNAPGVLVRVGELHLIKALSAS